MIRSQLFRKSYIVIVFVLLLFVLLGNMANILVSRIATPPRPHDSYPIFFAKLIERIDPQNKITALKELKELAEEDFPLKFFLVDHQGKILFPESGHKNFTLPFEWSKTYKPEQPLVTYEFRVAESADDEDNPGLLPYLVIGRPPSPHFGQIILLDGMPKQYLITLHRQNHGSFRWRVAASMLAMVVSVLLGLGFALFLLYRSLFKKVAMVDSVIEQLKNGNLKARLPVTKMDEIGQTMGRFNLMADEIERLVEQLRSTEQSRVVLLQELAHDLRTPIASLKNLIETIDIQKSKMSPQSLDEMIGLSLKEVDYFERLVEDLLFLAQISEPRYKLDQQKINLVELLEEEISSIVLRYPNKKINITNVFPNEDVIILGDEHLLRRLFRNTLDNSFSFAKEHLTIKMLVGTRKDVVLEVLDDGPGFSADGLKSFGKRRMTRVIESTDEGRLSVGLGSVIMCSVAKIHGGSAMACNETKSDGTVLGAKVVLTLAGTG